LQEAKDSSAIENIITTHDELYRSEVSDTKQISVSTKEVQRYALALRNGFEEIKRTQLITNNHIQVIQQELEGNNAGFRSQSGTVLKNDQTGEVIYTPPQDLASIQAYMKNLETFMNDNEICEWDALVKMAVVHHQFESIHPFFDGNGRTGRILNILYLVKEGLLDTPILYLSRYINQNKADYYRLLQDVRTRGAWEDWVLFMLEGVVQTSYQTIEIIDKMRDLMASHKQTIRVEMPKVYSQDLLNHLFKHPYTKVQFLEAELHIHRHTARRYLTKLVEIGILAPQKVGKETLYVNKDLYQLFYNVGATPLQDVYKK